jgi:hypothetical protein
MRTVQIQHQTTSRSPNPFAFDNSNTSHGELGLPCARLLLDGRRPASAGSPSASLESVAFSERQGA